MTTERIPFDLERALAGAALVTRGGWSVTDFRLADKGYTRYPYLATIHTPGKEPRDEWFTVTGRFFYDDAEGCNDLFMAEPPAQQPMTIRQFRVAIQPLLSKLCTGNELPLDDDWHACIRNIERHYGIGKGERNEG